jgi:hypothetical protein
MTTNPKPVAMTEAEHLVEDAARTPLIELLQRIPQDARLQWQEATGLRAHHSVPIGLYAHEAAAALAPANARIAELEAALKRIADYDIGIQALIEEGQDTPERRAIYYASQVERRRSIARAALNNQEAP